MTPEAQRIAIAKADGWEIAHEVGKPGSAVCGCTSDDLKPRQIPDYLNDLNAIQKAVRRPIVVPLDKRDEYCWRLSEITQRGRMAPCRWTSITADAAHCAEALLKTLRLWKES